MIYRNIKHICTIIIIYKLYKYIHIIVHFLKCTGYWFPACRYHGRPQLFHSPRKAMEPEHYTFAKEN